MSLPRMSKEESRKVSRWLNTTSLPQMRWGPRRKRSYRRDDRPYQDGRETRYEWISVKKILLPKSDDKLDEKIVAGIAESILVSDLLHPIAVRRVTQDDAEKIVLVAGAHRFEALKRLGRKKAPCFFVEGDDTDAQLVRLGENLWRKALTVLRQAEALIEYLNLASTKVNLSGQLGRKSKVGRPPGGIALAARELPLVGRSLEARRKIISRAIKINQITPEAKKALIKARLDNSQRALLKIAKAGGKKAQLGMVAQLADILKKLNGPLKRAAKPSANGGKASRETAVDTPPLQPDATRSANNPDETAGEEAGTYSPSQKVTTLDEMEVAWKAECQAKWAYLPSCDRERFIEMLRRARRRARVDVVEFLQDVFRGREKVSKQDLFGFAATHGFAKGTVRKTLERLGYPTKRNGHGSGARWFVRNPDRYWKDEFRLFPDGEIRAAVEAQPNPLDTVAAKDGWESRTRDSYYDDV